MSARDDADMKEFSNLWFECEYYNINDKTLRGQVVDGLWKLVKKPDFKEKYQVHRQSGICFRTLDCWCLDYGIFYGSELCLAIRNSDRLVTLAFPLYGRKQIEIWGSEDIYGLGGIYTCARNLYYYIASMEQRY